MVQTKNSKNADTSVPEENLNTEIQKLEVTLKTLLEEQNQKMIENSNLNSTNIDKNTRSIAELNELMLGLSLQITKLVSNEEGVGEIIVTNLEPPNRNQNQYSTRLTKVEFPKFSGDDLKSWLYKCTQFFEVDAVSDP